MDYENSTKIHLFVKISYISLLLRLIPSPSQSSSAMNITKGLLLAASYSSPYSSSSLFSLLPLLLLLY